MRTMGPCRSGSGRIVLAAVVLAALSGSAMVDAAVDERPREVRTLVTKWYVHGISYAQARALGPQAVPELVAMLREPAMEAHWTKVVWILGCIGDRAATGPLLAFLKGQRGEVSVDTFRATLAVLPALGHLARGGDPAALEALKSFSQLDSRKRAALSFSYGRYQGEALAEVLGRTAIQGLGIAGTREALEVLDSMNDGFLRADWKDNVEEAIALNARVLRVGPERAFAQEEDR